MVYGAGSAEGSVLFGREEGGVDNEVDGGLAGRAVFACSAVEGEEESAAARAYWVCTWRAFSISSPMKILV